MLDVRLPDLSGLSLQEKLAEANIDMPIIFITGFADIPMTVRAMKAGALEFLTKPINDQQFLDAMQLGIEQQTVAAARQVIGRGKDKVRSFHIKMLRRQGFCGTRSFGDAYGFEACAAV